MDELILLAQKGDEKALEEFFGTYKALVAKVCRRYFLLGGEKEDIIQEGMVGLYKALMAFDTTKNASFKTFATLCITRQVVNAVKQYSNLKNRPLNSGLSINMEGGVSVFSSSEEHSGDDESYFYIIPSPEPSPQDIILSDERMKEVILEIEKLLSDLEKKVLAKYLQGKSQLQIASELKTSSKSIDNAITRIKSKLAYLK
ncbi:MAG: sigma-70 family RNA polymerase sigma factor [Clostridia bacterium]